MSARGYDDVAVFGFPIKTAGTIIVVDLGFTNNIGRFHNELEISSQNQRLFHLET